MPAPNLLLLPLHHPLRRALRRQGSKALRIRRHRMRNRLRILNERVHIQVRHIIPHGVIIHIERHARLPTKQRLLLGRLNVLGARKQAAGGNAHILERAIVTPPAELLGHPLQAGLIGEVILEELLRFGGARGAGEVEGRAVAVVNAVLVIGGGDHIKVELEADLGLFGVREGGDVEFGAEETKLLSGYPDEANGVVDAVFGELEGDFEETDATGAVIVDTRALDEGRLAADSVRKMVDSTGASGFDAGRP